MQDKEYYNNLIQQASPDGGFLQSVEWRKFQEAVGRKTFTVSENNFYASIIEHELPIVGKYFYIPRGPVILAPAFARINSSGNPVSRLRRLDSGSEAGMTKLLDLAKKNNAAWIRFDANDSRILDIIHENSQAVFKAPHDMQSKEIFLIDITKPEEQLLAEMKAKTRYNIKLAQKHNVKIIKCEKSDATCDRAIDEFVRLMKITALRDKITPHPDSYYRKMFEAVSEENLKLYLAEFEGKIITANIIIFYGKVATYLHGVSGNDYRNVMAPYFLQWQAMLDAKEAGCEKYDMGGVKTHNANRIAHNADDTRYVIRDTSSWAGITRFKTGFSVAAAPIKFPGSYDIVINPFKYNLYKILQRIKALF